MSGSETGRWPVRLDSQKIELGLARRSLGSVGALQYWCEDQVICEWFLTLHPAICLLL